MQQSSTSVTNDFCNIDSETKEETVTNLRNIYSDLTKGSNFTCTNHHEGCPAKNENVENDTSQYLYVGNEVFLYNCHCDFGGIKKDSKFLLQTLNGEEAIPVGVMRNYVKPTTVMTLKPEVGPSRAANSCPCARCHQVSSIGCCCKGCVVEDDYVACSTQRYYQCEGLSVKISNASCCFCDRGKQTHEENAALVEERKFDDEQASDLISKLNDIEKQINLTNMNVGNITHDNDFFSNLLNELSQLISSFKEGDRNLINTIEALKLKLVSLEKGLKCVFKDSECFQEVYQEKRISHSALSLRDEIDIKPKKVKKNGISSILLVKDSQKGDSPVADRPSGISRKIDARTDTETITEAEKPADIVSQYDINTESISEAVTPAESSHEFDAQLESISEAEIPADISHEFDARIESEAGTPAESSHEFDAQIKIIRDEKKTADIVSHNDAQTDNIRETVTPAEVSHQFDARAESVSEVETSPEIRDQSGVRTRSIREAIKPVVSKRHVGMQVEIIKAVTPPGSSHRFDAKIKSSDNKVSEKNTLQADRDTINKTTEKNKTDTTAEHIHQIKERVMNGLKTGTIGKLKTEHQKKVPTTDSGTQTGKLIKIEDMGKVSKRDKPADDIPQTDADTSAERKYKFDIEAVSCSQDDDNYQNLTDNIQINGETECCFKVKIKKIKILGETSSFKENNNIKRKSVDFVESLNGSNKTTQAKEETPIPSLNKVSEEPTVFSEITELAEAGKSTAGKSMTFAQTNGIEKHKKPGESSKKKMAKSLGRPKENGKELQPKQKFETAKKKKKHLSTNED